jgi:hypothetical protein
MVRHNYDQTGRGNAPACSSLNRRSFLQNRMVHKALISTLENIGLFASDSAVGLWSFAYSIWTT